MQLDAAIIGGTGIGELLQEVPGKAIHVPTEFGTVRGKIVEIQSKRVLALSRHAAGHKVPPHAVPYRALARACKLLSVKFCLSSAAVGSLRPDLPAGSMVVCSDFIDLTARNVTMHDKSVVHTDFTAPFPARNHLLNAAKDLDVLVQDGGIYLNGNGPRYETPYEIQLYKKLGADVVGMTAATEAIVMREAGVNYACLAIVTNLAAGISATELSHEEVVAEMKKSGKTAMKIFESAIGAA